MFRSSEIKLTRKINEKNKLNLLIFVLKNQ